MMLLIIAGSPAAALSRPSTPGQRKRAALPQLSDTSISFRKCVAGAVLTNEIAATHKETNYYCPDIYAASMPFRR